MKLNLVVLILCLSLFTGCSKPDVPLDIPITLQPRGVIEQNVQIKNNVNYLIDFVFARDSVPFDDLKKLIGAMGICQIGEFCSKGVVVPVSWSLRSSESGRVVAFGKIDSFDSAGWSVADVHRRIGSFTVERGSYIFKLEVLRDTPELALFRTRVTIYHPFK